MVNSETKQKQFQFIGTLINVGMSSLFLLFGFKFEAVEILSAIHYKTLLL